MKTATTVSLLSMHTQKKIRKSWQEPNCGSGDTSSFTLEIWSEHELPTNQPEE